ncbi:MAG: hypothetical protein K8R02_09255 [Anaerohalosphaeraceae bacterium]|nr:hypothetical protein [Anaerohalosphaeraceae bacterium]
MLRTASPDFSVPFVSLVPVEMTMAHLIIGIGIIPMWIEAGINVCDHGVPHDISWQNYVKYVGPMAKHTDWL